jgi:hypothetical protein
VPLKLYFPFSVATFILVVALAYHFAVPIGPFAAILLVGETLLGLQLENHTAPRALKRVLEVKKPDRRRA